MTYCLDPEAVISINKEHVHREGEPFGLRDCNGMLGALARPLLGFDGTYKFPTTVTKAGALVEGLLQAHPFIQGNKRTAWSAGTTYLGLHGFSIEANDEDVVGMMLAATDGEHDAISIALWIADRIVLGTDEKRPPPSHGG